MFLGAALTVAHGQERFRLADPQALSASGSGWSVEPRTGGLSGALPVAVVPGELPIPVTLGLSGQFKVQVAKIYYWDTSDPIKPRWVYVRDNDVIRPMFAAMHFGYISPASRYDGPPGTETFVLEDGFQFRTTDLVLYSGLSTKPFTLPQDFGISDKTPSPQVTSLSSHAVYTAIGADFSPTWQARLQATLPVGFGPLADSYRIVMDKDRARILVKLPDQQVWVPLGWADRFGHWVTFKWTKSLSGLPAGTTAITSVEAKNQRGKGVLVQWAAYSTTNVIQDLVRADFIGVDAPAVLIKGYPGITTSLPVGVPPRVNSIALAGGTVGGSVGRPTSVMIGSARDLALPSWNGSPSAPLVPPQPGEASTVPVRTWTFEYDASRAALTAMTDALGVRTTFGYEFLGVSTTQTGAYDDLPSGSTQQYLMGDLAAWAVKSSTALDPTTSTTLSRSWTRGALATGEPTVTMKESFGPLDTVPRWTELVYVRSLDGNGRDYGNGQLKESRLWELNKSLPTATTTYTLEGAGLDGSYSFANGVVVKRSGEPTLTLARVSSPAGMSPVFESLFKGEPGLKVQQTSYTYEKQLEKLDPQRLTQSDTTRFSAAGAALTPVVTSKLEYDGKRLVQKSYRLLGSAQKGAAYTYDAEGRIVSEQGWFGDSAIVPPASRQRAFDAASGLLASQTLTFGLNGGGTASLQQGWSNYDSAGRARTATDERGQSTQVTFDLLGRASTIQGPAGPATTVTFPDDRTRQVTRGTLTSREFQDGFGRVLRREFPDGSKEEIYYDVLGRPEKVQGTSRLGAVNAPAVTVYDALDRPTIQTSPGGASQTFAYGTSGPNGAWMMTTRTLNTPTTTATSKIHVDQFGQTVKDESPLGTLTESTYNPLGKLTKVVITPAGGGTPQIREFFFDDWGRMTQRSEPETGSTLFGNFNLLDQPTRIEEAGGRVRTLTYDGLGRMVAMESGKEKLTTTYEGVDVKTQSSVSDGVEVRQEFEYLGPAKQLSLERTLQPGLTTEINYGFDATSGLLTSMTYPSGRTVGYTRDTLDRITGITQNGAPLVSSVTFNEWGSRERLTFASGAYSDWTTQDGGTHLGQWNIGHNSVLLDGTRFYQYDSAERLTMAGEWDQLEHDLQGRLTKANATSLGISTLHGHDAYGNNTTHTATGPIPNGVTNNFAFNPLPTNQLPGLDKNGALTGWVVNARGEAQQAGTESGAPKSLGFAWDSLGRLRAVSYGNGFQSYLYAPSGLRVSAVDSATPGNNRRYAYTQGGLLLSEYVEAAGAPTLMATPETAPAKPKTQSGKAVAYVLPIAGDTPATAWIVQPAGATTVKVGQALAFEGDSMYGTTFRWTFGDGASATGRTASHAFAATGTYTVTFKASASGYVASTATVTVTVVPNSLPTLGTFTANATTLPEGGYADLSWSTSNATSVTLTGAGTVAATGTLRVWPTATRTYTLTATNSAGSVSANLTLTLVAAPVITSFVATPATIQAGAATRLTWQVSNATTYALDQQVGSVPGTWAWVWPGTSTTFTLTATNTLNGVSVSRTATATVTVGAALGVAWKRDVVYLGDEPVAEIDAAGVHELHLDHLGTPRIVTSGSTGQIEGRMMMGAYGERIQADGYLPLTGFTGHLQQDATGLIYMRGRYYTPAWHRFLNSDQGVDPSSWNQMAYGGGSPFHATDPSGLIREITVEVTGTYPIADYIFSSNSPFGGFFEGLGPIALRRGGGRGKGAAKPPRATIDKDKCDKIKQMIAFEKLFGTDRTVAKYSRTFGTNGVYEFTNGYPYQNLTPTTIGNMDVDWFLDLTYALRGVSPSSKLIRADLVYRPAKKIWDKVQFVANEFGDSEDGNGYHAENPYDDPGEYVAVVGAANNARLSDLWPQQWLDKNCPK